jgi:hypothetical protein
MYTTSCFLCNINMLKIFIKLFFFVLIPFSSQSKVRMTDIVFNQRFHDFGIIYEEDGIVTAKYDFTNYANSPFIISNIDAACGCTNPRSSKDTFMPGESGQILAEFNPKGMVGKTKKWIYVRGNYEDGYQIELKFEAEIRSRYNRNNYEYLRGEFGYLLSDKIKFDWGKRFENDQFNDTFEFTNDGYNDIIVSKITSTAPFIIPPKLPITIPVGQKSNLIFNIDLSKIDTIGPISGYILFKTNDKFFPKKKTPYSLDLITNFNAWKRKELKNAAHIEFESKVIQMGSMSSGSVRSQKIIINNIGKSILNIRKIESDCSCTMLKLPTNKILPGGSLVTSIKYDSLYKKGKQSKLIKIYTNDPLNPIVTLYVKAIVK